MSQRAPGGVELDVFAEHRMGWKEAVADAHANEDHRRFIVKVSNTGGKL
jgi:hypothetical protein